MSDRPRGLGGRMRRLASLFVLSLPAKLQAPGDRWLRFTIVPDGVGEPAEPSSDPGRTR